MYVRKFEAESLDEALKNIKRELGPDAIILKTVTNKGAKGMFKKNKIEITAAISEKSYVKKSRVDNVLTDDERSNFYQSPASDIASMINHHDEVTSQEAKAKSVNVASGYGHMGLNKAVSTTKSVGGKIKRGLDDFLSTSNKTETETAANNTANSLDIDQFINQSFDKEVLPGQAQKTTQAQSPQFPPPVTEQQSTRGTNVLVEKQRERIDELESRLFEIQNRLASIEDRGPIGVFQLATTLRSLDIDEAHIQELMRKATFELTREEQEDPDTVFEFGLREMLSEINTEMPVFSTVDTAKNPVVTVLLSEAASGQTTVALKLTAMLKGSVLIQYDGRVETSGHDLSDTRSLAEEFFGFKVERVTTTAEVASVARKAIENGMSVFVDFRVGKKETEEVKKFILGLKRSFDKVESLICVSAIHSGLYNKKMATRYLELVEGMVISHLDLCINYGPIYNLAKDLPSLPLKFFGTGDVVPDDLEAATAERLLAGIFKL